MYKNVNVSPVARSPFPGGSNPAAPLASIEFDYPKGSEIFGSSETAEYVYQVVDGAVRTYNVLSDGRRQIGAFHLPGDIFGLEFDDNHRFSADAIVATKLRLVRRQTMERLAETDLAMMTFLLRTTNTSLARAEDRLLLLGQKTALERVSAFLVEMEGRSNAAGMMALSMTRLDIADYLGLTIETVSRALTALKKLGLIKFMGTQRDIVVVDIKGLSSIADGSARDA